MKLDHIKEALAAMTPGDWTPYRYYQPGDADYEDGTSWYCHFGDDPFKYGDTSTGNEANAKGICILKNNAPDMIEEIERLRGAQDDAYLVAWAVTHAWSRSFVYFYEAGTVQWQWYENDTLVKSEPIAPWEGRHNQLPPLNDQVRESIKSAILEVEEMQAKQALEEGK